MEEQKRAKELTKRKPRSVWRELLLKSKCSWRQSVPRVMTCHQKLVHQKLKIT